MAIKFASILAVLGLGSTTEAVTEAHLQAADDKIAQLEQDKKAADLKAEQAATALKTAEDEKTKLAGDLKASEEKTKTLEEWKKNQAQVDGREEDDSNTLEDGQGEPLASFEKASASAIASAKKRLGDK
jgi:chromosome segregation ATPase